MLADFIFEDRVSFDHTPRKFSALKITCYTVVNCKKTLERQVIIMLNIERDCYMYKEEDTK